MSDVDDLLAQAEEAQREYAEYALKADEARRRADAARVAAARADELSADEYARTAGADETRIRELRNRDLPQAPSAVPDDDYSVGVVDEPEEAPAEDYDAIEPTEGDVVTEPEDEPKKKGWLK